MVCPTVYRNRLRDPHFFLRRQTALHKAAWYQRRTICRMLVQAGSDLFLKDKQGHTPRDQALRAEDQELANFLEYQEHLQQTQGSSTEVWCHDSDLSFIFKVILHIPNALYWPLWFDHKITTVSLDGRKWCHYYVCSACWHALHTFLHYVPSTVTVLWLRVTSDCSPSIDRYHSHFYVSLKYLTQ